MPKNIKNVDQRAIVLKALLEVIRSFCGAYFEGRRVASCADDLVLCAAIFVGHSEGRPLNASKLAEYAGMARATVIRKAVNLEREGIIERVGQNFIMRPEVGNSELVMAAADKSKCVIIKAALQLSKLDTKAIA